MRAMADRRDRRDDALQGNQLVLPDTRRKVKRPRLYKVLLHNDDYTTMEFVVHVLITVFHRSETDAVRIMLSVHKQGIGVAGIYPREIAESRIAKVTRLARQHEFPLRCTMEPA
ncbi:MAG: ATP-dependent Clp protease adapter ClpS [Deferrisomatales bacterium]